MSVDFSKPVLVVEDMRTMGHIVSLLLKQIGFKHVDVADGGFTAFCRLQTCGYALVISDWNMAPMSGLDLLRKVRATEELASTPFIIMAATSSRDQVMAARLAGADAFISKPFSALVLKQRIDALFAAAPSPYCNDLQVVTSGASHG